MTKSKVRARFRYERSKPRWSLNAISGAGETKEKSLKSSVGGSTAGRSVHRNYTNGGVDRLLRDRQRTQNRRRKEERAYRKRRVNHPSSQHAEQEKRKKAIVNVEEHREVHQGGTDKFSRERRKRKREAGTLVTTRTIARKQAGKNHLCLASTVKERTKTDPQAAMEEKGKQAHAETAATVGS